MPGLIKVALNIAKALDAIKDKERQLLDAQVDAAARIARNTIARDSEWAADNIYAIHVGGAARPAASDLRINRRGRRSLRTAESVAAPPKGAAAFGCAASYAQAIELRDHTFSNAARAAWEEAQDTIAGTL